MNPVNPDAYMTAAAYYAARAAQRRESSVRDMSSDSSRYLYSYGSGSGSSSKPNDLSVGPVAPVPPRLSDSSSKRSGGAAGSSTRRSDPFSYLFGERW